MRWEVNKRKNIIICCNFMWKWWKFNKIYLNENTELDKPML